MFVLCMCYITEQVTDVLIEEPRVSETESSLCQQHVFPSLGDTSPVNTHQIFSSPPTLTNTVKRYASV